MNWQKIGEFYEAWEKNISFGTTTMGIESAHDGLTLIRLSIAVRTAGQPVFVTSCLTPREIEKASGGPTAMGVFFAAEMKHRFRQLTTPPITDPPTCGCGSITVKNGDRYKCLNCGKSHPLPFTCAVCSRLRPGDPPPVDGLCVDCRH